MTKITCYQFVYLLLYVNPRYFLFTQVPYLVMLAFAGLPIFFMEIVLGQYTGVGPVKIFGRMAPLLRGLGYVSITYPITLH